MKSLIWAFIVVCLLIVSVFLNSIIVSYNIKEVISRLEKLPDELSSEGEYLDIKNDFIKMRKYFSFTVNHEDIADVEHEFSDLTGSLAAKDKESFIISKSRLIDALTHLKRLSGINLESIF